MLHLSRTMLSVQREIFVQKWGPNVPEQPGIWQELRSREYRMLKGLPLERVRPCGQVPVEGGGEEYEFFLSQATASSRSVKALLVIPRLAATTMSNMSSAINSDFATMARRNLPPEV